MGSFGLRKGMAAAVALTVVAGAWGGQSCFIPRQGAETRMLVYWRLFLYIHTQPYNINMQYKQNKYKLNIKMLNYGFTSGLSQRTLLRKWKDILENGRKYMQILCFLRDLYLRYIKNIQVSDEKERTMGSEQKIWIGVWPKSKHNCHKLLRGVRHHWPQGNANRNHSTPTMTSASWQKPMLSRR